MTKMLERAARAAYGAYGFTSPWTEDYGYGVAQPDTKETFRNVARAVLMAVRDLDREIVKETHKATVEVGGNMADFLGASDWKVSGSFARAIDTILSETP